MVETHTNLNPRPIQTRMDYGIQKLRLFTSILVGLYVVYVITATLPILSEMEGMIIFGSVLGSTVFTFYLMLQLELKKRKKLRN